MADLLDSIRRQLRQRLDDLRPLVSEYERLQSADTALGSERPPRSGRAETERSRAPRRNRPRSSGPRRASSPAERQANREKVLAIIGERPGVTKAELKEAAGLSTAGVAQNLRRLTDGGYVVEEPLPGGDAGYRLRRSDVTSAGREAPNADAETETASAG